LLGLWLIWAAVLRETPAFWRDAGGSLIPLRHAVLISFYPLVVASILLAAATWRAAPRPAGAGSKPRAVLLGLCLAQWMLLAGVVAVATWNNLGNVIYGRPFHSHQE
jgi:hypothetical protein